MFHLTKRPLWPLLALLLVTLLTLASGVAFAGKGPGGPSTTTAGTTTTTATTTTTTTTAPAPDTGASVTGSLFGDLYVLLRYFGGGTPGEPADAVGGEPILSWEPGWEAYEISENPDGTINYGVRLASVASGCLQPVADAERWGDIWHPAGYAADDVWHQVICEAPPADFTEDPATLLFTCTLCGYAYDPAKNLDAAGDPIPFADLPDGWTCPGAVWEPITGPSGYELGLDKNRIPLVLVYTISGPADGSWASTEAEIGLLRSVPGVDPTGSLILDVDPYFIQPGGTWTDPRNGEVTYPDGVLWTDLVQEVGFGRISVSRSPEAVLQASFDEVVNSINSPDTVAIEIDSAGRLLLTKYLYEEYLVDPTTGLPLHVTDPVTGEWVTVKKAIDSPLENLALYTKLLNDGHLVTPGDEREPIDRSAEGGIPIWKEIEMEDGPANELRPTIDIAKMRDWGLGALVDVAEVDYYAYYTEIPATTTTTHRGRPDQDPAVLPEFKVEPAIPVPADLPAGTEVSTGIMTDDGQSPSGVDFAFAAAFLAAAADKTTDISVDLIVYLNSILGINKVVDEYADDPEYFDFAAMPFYGRAATFASRGEVTSTGGGGAPSAYSGSVRVLQSAGVTTWTETDYSLASLAFDDLGLDAEHFPNHSTAASNLLGFTQMADDDLTVIEFIHTYQIPERR